MSIPHTAGKSALLSALIALGLPVTTRAQSEEAVVQLPPVEITADTPGTYAPKHSSSASKSDAALLDTPMAVQVVAAEVIRDRHITSTLEAVRQVSGVQAQPGTFYDQFQIRGFGSGYGVTYRNGLQLEGVANAVDPAFIERIEVVKGPASMLYGRVEPGGFVNVVTKRPSAAAGVEIEQQFSSWRGRQTTLDATGPLSNHGDLAYRLIGTAGTGNDFYDFQHYNRKAILGALAWRASSQFDANLSFEYNNDKSGGRGPNATAPQLGDRPDRSVPRSRAQGDPALWNHFPDTVRRHLVAFDWTYRFNEKWKLTQRFHRMGVDERQSGLSDWGGVWGFFYNPVTRDVVHTNLDLSGTITTGTLKHDLLFGADFFRYRDDWKGFSGATSIPFVSIYDPGYVDPTPDLRALVDEARHNGLWKTFEADRGVYVQDRIALSEAWSVLVGGRWDRAWLRYGSVYGAVSEPCYPHCTPLPMSSWPADSAFSPRAATMYKLDARTSLYASYSKSFGANNSSLLASGASVEPEVGVQYELGIKHALADERLLASATLFNLTKSNVLAEDPNDRTRQIAIGQIRSRGLEVDVLGRLTPRLNILASYTLNPVKITRDTNDPSNQDHRRAGAPLHAASVWLKYAAHQSGQGWAFGAGVLANGSRQGDDANTWQLPGYASVDAMASYAMQLAGHAAQVQFNVKNVFDRVYFDQVSNGFAAYGAPRAWALNLKLAL